jgi:hypothetical protein
VSCLEKKVRDREFSCSKSLEKRRISWVHCASKVLFVSSLWISAVRKMLYVIGVNTFLGWLIVKINTLLFCVEEKKIFERERCYCFARRCFYASILFYVDPVVQYTVTMNKLFCSSLLFVVINWERETFWFVLLFEEWWFWERERINMFSTKPFFI